MIIQISILVLCIAWAMCSMFYTGVVRPGLRDEARYLLFAERDELRRLAIDGNVDPSSFPYMYLERFLCKLIDHCYWYSFGNIWEFFKLHPDAPLPADAARFERKAPEELKAIRDRAISHIILAMAINSPIYAAYLLCASHVKSKLTKQATTYLQEPSDNEGPFGNGPGNGMMTGSPLSGAAA